MIVDFWLLGIAFILLNFLRHSSSLRKLNNQVRSTKAKGIIHKTYNSLILSTTLLVLLSSMLIPKLGLYALLAICILVFFIVTGDSRKLISMRLRKSRNLIVIQYMVSITLIIMFGVTFITS